MPSTNTCATLTLLLALASCTDDAGGGESSDGGSESSGGTTTTMSSTTIDPDTSTGPTTTGESSSSDESSSSSADESESSSSTGEPGEPTVEIITALDAMAYELPEGLYVDGDEAVVGFAFTGAVERIALADGTRNAFAATPPPPPNTSFVTGVTLDDQGRLYAAVVSFTADLQAGIYRADADGGDATLWASDPGIVFPNGFAWDDEGRLFVSDSVGGISRIDADATVTPWFSDPQLAGDPMACGQNAAFTVGPNGIAWTPDTLWVASSDQGILASVAIAANGDAGALSLVVGPDCALGGIDGITLDDDGTIVAAINRQDRIVRITPAGDVSTIVEGDPLAFPATVEFADGGDLIVTNFALDDFFAGTPASPSLARVVFP